MRGREGGKERTKPTLFHAESQACLRSRERRNGTPSRGTERPWQHKGDRWDRPDKSRMRGSGRENRGWEEDLGLVRQMGGLGRGMLSRDRQAPRSQKEEERGTIHNMYSLFRVSP